MEKEIIIEELFESEILEPLSNNQRVDISESGFWMVSSSKSNNGVEELKKPDNSIFWQTDGKSPHFIEINFNTATKLSEVWIYLDYHKDESYCPRKLEFQLMNLLGDLVTVKIVFIERGQGWFKIDLCEYSDTGLIEK
jgi:anaphase-promoting complex subunit 10